MPTLTNTHLGTPSRAAKATYPGNYLGIVVQNNDPEQRGQIKVWVPHISPTVYKDWLNSKEDKKFRFIGENIDSDLTGVMDELKDILPWAQCAAPLMGASSSGRYNAHLKTGTISDSSRVEETDPKEDFVKTKYSLNKDGIGEKPARMYEVDDLRLNDAFNDTAANQTNKINKYSYNYTPNSYSNAAKGSFSIPNVGSHVWVFFQGGDPMSPVYFATSFGQEDWKGIYEIEDDAGIDYPGTYENKSTKDDSTYNHNTEAYRNKFVFNQKGGSLEIVSTDNKELLKLTHFGGSFLEFNNDTTTQFAAGNDQKLVLEDQFHTIKGFKNQWVEKDYDLLVRGDFYTKIGNFNREYIQTWRDIVANIANYKQLFEIKRCTYDEKTITGNELLQRVSPHQVKSGTHAKCPVCSADTREKAWSFDYAYTGYTPVNDTADIDGSNQLSGDWMGSDGGASTTDDDSAAFTSVASTIATPGAVIPTAGTSSSFLGGTCPCCGGTLLSPSSQGGTWDVDERKDEKVTEQLRENIKNLLVLEKQFGVGGSSIINITKHKLENIGLVFNDMPSIRVDHFGKISKNEVKIQPGGVVTNQKASPLVEYVHVDDLPGGSYNLNVCNRFNVQVGSGGIQMKSYGPVDISGTVTNIAGEQINISSDHEINIESKGRVNISADILALRQRNYGQVLVDSNLGVSQNVIVGGGMHVEGELSVQHVTAPVEFQQTEVVEQAVKLLTGHAFAASINFPGSNTNGNDWGGGGNTVGSGTITFTGGVAGNEDIGYTTPHSHQFRNLPLTLLQKESDVRQVGKNNENPVKTGPFPVKHEKKTAQSFDNENDV